MKKPQLTTAQIWNMSMGFLGIQFGFALQNANASRILQNFGADVEHLSWFWLAAPVTGLVIQPIIGHYSDNTWNKLGRRKPYFLTGAILASIALCFMPNSGALAAFIPPMFVGAGILMIMDASINIAMEPFRALVGDMLPSEQRTQGFSVQAALIGFGAVFGSFLPYMLAEWVGISKVAAPGEVPDNVIYSFYFGALVFIATIIWTLAKTKEYPPKELAKYNDSEETHEEGSILDIFKDFAAMPNTMKQLGLVQFFSWFALFSMWVFCTPAIAQHVFGTDVNDTSSLAYNDAGNWVGVMFTVYNAVSVFFALSLPKIAARLGRKKTHAFALAAGGIGMLLIYFIPTQAVTLIAMILIGLAWASILSMPYAILAGSIPAHKMGIYMGIFNFFIVVPQIVNGIFAGPVIKRIFESEAIYALIFAGISLLIAALSVRFVDDKDEVVSQ
ncbi:MAG: SLC45 family MFS transporter [Cyclobacteriaceae bacterium]